MKPLVYIDAAPSLHEGDVNAWHWNQLCDELLCDGLVIPFLPFWCLLGLASMPMDFTDWETHQYELVESIPFDACLRPDFECVLTVGGHVVRPAARVSDATRMFDRRGVPVFHEKAALYGWCSKSSAR